MKVTNNNQIILQEQHMDSVVHVFYLVEKLKMDVKNLMNKLDLAEKTIILADSNFKHCDNLKVSLTKKNTFLDSIIVYKEQKITLYKQNELVFDGLMKEGKKKGKKKMFLGILGGFISGSISTTIFLFTK